MEIETAQIIGARRRALGLSQEQLAEKLGVSRQAVSKWETGESLPDTDKLLSLASALEMTADELLGLPGEGESASAPPSRRERAGWLALHWYWLGLLLMAAGLLAGLARLADGLMLYRTLSLYAPIFALYGGQGDHLVGNVIPEGCVSDQGEIVFTLVYLRLAQGAALLLAGAALGAALFLLGRRHVGRKYGLG